MNRTNPKPIATRPARTPAPESNPMGFVLMTRGNDAFELIRFNPKAYIIASLIALRARWNKNGQFNADGCELGEAFLGDHWNYKMSQQEYRTAKTHLRKWRFATFRRTNRGTIGKLIDTRLFDPLRHSNNEQNNGQTTNKQRTDNEQTTTNQECKKGKKRERESDFQSAAPMNRQDYNELVERKGIGEDCANWLWDTYEARNWCDPVGQPVRSIEALLNKTWREWKHRNPNDPVRGPSPLDLKIWIESAKKRLRQLNLQIPTGPVSTPDRKLVAERDQVIKKIAKLEDQLANGQNQSPKPGA